ncbi:hypothetical protein MMC14_003691 [Varicellaria rhodocarpa]|nr:hypothetical protein [Varicellaria rhodocarpa]
MDQTKDFPKTDFQSEEEDKLSVETIPFLWQAEVVDEKPTPALHVVNEEYQTWKMNGTLRTSSSYRGPPSSEIDAAWEKLWKVSSFRLSTEGLKRMNGSEDSVSFLPNEGGGYLASLAVNHQLHCVHFLWQQTHQEYYWDDPKHDTRPSNNISGIVREHIDHCADILRQKIMCDADTGVILYNWVKGYPSPYPNFNTRHKCRNFDDVLQWAVENQEANSGILNLERTQDSVQLELPP